MELENVTTKGPEDSDGGQPIAIEMASLPIAVPKHSQFTPKSLPFLQFLSKTGARRK
jgi:hypothetical protein